MAITCGERLLATLLNSEILGRRLLALKCIIESWSVWGLGFHWGDGLGVNTGAFGFRVIAELVVWLMIRGTFCEATCTFIAGDGPLVFISAVIMQISTDVNSRGFLELPSTGVYVIGPFSAFHNVSMAFWNDHIRCLCSTSSWWDPAAVEDRTLVF